MALQLPAGWLRVALASLLLGMAFGWYLAPDGIGADEPALYFHATGHRLDNQHGFLGFWRAADGPLLLGAPVTEPLIEDGRVVQYFEQGRLERHPEYGEAILLGRVAAEYQAALWQSFPPAPAPESAVGVEYFAVTGHSLGEPFLVFWQTHGSLDAFGYPISEPLWEYLGSEMVRVQYFERVRLEYRPAPGDGSVRISPLGLALALLRGHVVEAVEAAGALPVDNAGNAVQLSPTPAGRPVQAPAAIATARPAPPVQPAPAAQPAAPGSATAPRPGGGKKVVVDLSDQWLYAYQGERIVFDAPVSTGRDGFNTPTGNYAIYAKVRSQTMRGCAGGECWNVPNVPHAMYINGGVALHGTYWHNQFGSGVRRSHGCVNLPLKAAAWLYEWAPMGTPVMVRW